MEIKVITNHRRLGEFNRTSHYTINTNHDDAVLVVKWNWLKFDEPTPLVNVSNLLAGDTVWTLHKGKAVITEVLKGFFRFNGEQNLFAVQPGMSFPLVSRGDHSGEPVEYNW